MLARLSQDRGWPVPEPTGSDVVRWGPEGTVARAPRASTGDKEQLAALVALRSNAFDPTAVAAAIVRPVVEATLPQRRPQEPPAPPPADGATGIRVLDVAKEICGCDPNAGRRRDKGGRKMSYDEIDQLKERVLDRTVTWGKGERGVVVEVTLCGADLVPLSGFSGLDVNVATYYRLQGDGERWGIRAAAKHLGQSDDQVAELRAALVRRKPFEYQSFPCLVVKQRPNQKVPDNVPVELALLVDAESKDDHDV